MQEFANKDLVTVQPASFRLISTAISTLLLVLFFLVIWVVVRDNAGTMQGPPPNPTGAPVAQINSQAPSPTAPSPTAPVATPAESTPPAATPTTQDPVATTPAPASVPATATPAEEGAANGAMLIVPDAETPAPRTPTPVVTQGPVPDLAAGTWRIYSDANFANALAPARSTLWVATGGGIVAWNRNSGSFVKFTTLDGLATNHTTSVANCELPELGVIFGSSHGLQIFDMGDGRWRTWDSSNSGMRADDVTTLYCDPQGGYLLIGYGQQGLDLYDARTRSWAAIGPAEGLAPGLIREIAVGRTGAEVWLAGEQGLYRLTGLVSPEGAVTTTVEEPGEAAEEGDATVPAAVELAINSDSVPTKTGTLVEGDLFTGTEDLAGSDLVDSDLAAGTAVATGAGTVTPAEILSATVAVPEEVEFAALLEITIEEFTSANSDLDSDTIYAVAMDGAGTVWFTTASALYRIDGEEWTRYAEGDSAGAGYPNGRLVGLDIAPDGAIWLGSDQTQLCQFDPRAGRCVVFFANETGMADAPLTALATGEDGLVYYATAGAGISFYNGEQWQQFSLPNELLPGNSVRNLMADASGGMWAGTNRGAAHITGENSGVQYTNREVPLPAPYVDAIAAVEGSLWFGSNGLTHFDGENWLTYGIDEGLINDEVRAVAVDNQNRVWAGTAGGLSVWTGNTFFNLSTANGLPSDDINTLLADGPVIWIGARDGGLLRFENNQLQVFNTDNTPLPSNDVTALAVAPGEILYVGTDQGIARYADGTIEPLAGLSPGLITALAAGPDGEIWAVTGDHHLLFSPDGSYWERFATIPFLPSRQITALAVDSAGNLWIGCERGGLARYTPKWVE
jgi:ligand-binding sensor domain-containing protein